MSRSFTTRAFLLASAITLSSTAVLAQDTTTTADANLSNTTNTDSMDTMGPAALPATDDIALAQTVQPERKDDDDFPWGLLGLLGLAGLLGLKRRDDHDVHIDRTTNDRTGTTINRL
jgi:MYXO-CTERM domain-containing protein